MVTATRRGVVAAKTADISSVDVSDSGNVKVNGKRKTRPTSAGKSESTTSTSKRRKRQIPEDEHHTTIKSDTVNESATAELAENNVSAASSGKHMRFGSEAPDVPLEPQPEEEPVLQTAADRYEDEDDSDSDDEAPETIDNSAQLVKIKAEAKKLEIAKSIEEQLKRDKRRQLDEQRKSQAKSSKKKDTLTAKAPTAATADDRISESTVTLQGSFTQDTRRPALPTLLPDEILNAEPADLSPAPLDEFNFGVRKPNKLRFLEKTEKAPKDVKLGDVTIRVLDGDKRKTGLAPKVSKVGRSVKENWLGRNNGAAQKNGLRKAPGGASGFVRSR